MNPLQETIARVVGLDEVIAEQNSVLTEHQEQYGELRDAFEHLYSDNQMLQRTIEDIDYLNLADTSQIAEILPGDRKKTIAKLRRLRHDNPLAKQAVKLIVRFTLGKGVQWVLAAEADEEQLDEEVPVPGPKPVPGAPGNPEEPTSKAPYAGTKFVQLPRAARAREQESDQIRDIVEAFWNDRDNKLCLTSHRAMQEMLDDVVTDGEKFYACFAAEGEPYVKVTEIPIEEIDGIIYNPDNRVEPVLYRRHFQELVYDGDNDQYQPGNKPPQVKYYLDYRITDEKWNELKKKIKIPAAKLAKDAKIRQAYVNPLWTKQGKRGISELYSSREWFRVFREFMEGRAAINQAAQSISFKRKVKAGPTSVARFQGTFGGRSVGEDAGTEVQKLTRPVPAGIYDHNEAVDLDWMKTDTGASNAVQDAKMLLTTGGAGVGTMAHYFGEGGDANLATAQSMELPMVKSYEDWQQWIDDEYREWIRYALFVALNGDDKLVDEALERLGFTFPPIVSQDVVKYTTSWAQIVRDIAPNNMRVKQEAIRQSLAIMGVANIDGIMPEVEAQMEQAEQLRIQQQQALAAAFNEAPQGPRPLPNEGQDPNTKHLLKGNGEKEANGPKSA